MGFKNAVVAGTVLVRPAIQSPNYIPGLAGWSINVDGTAEFLDLNIRGQFSTGPPGSQHVAINDNSGIARVELWSGDAQEISPLFLANFVNGGISFGQLDSSDDGQGVISIGFLAPQAAQPGIWFFFNSGTVSPAIVEYDTDVAQLLLNTNSESLASTNHPLQIGPGNASNLRFDFQSVEAVNNGVAAPMFLNFNGGDVNIGGGAGNGGLIAPRMRISSGADANSRTTASLTYVVGTLTASVTTVYPASGLVTIAVQSWMSTNLAAQSAFISFEIRDNNAAGTVRFVAADGAAAKVQGTAEMTASITVPIAVPTSGVMFIRAMMKVDGGTGTFTRTRVTVMPSG